jgi:hypothetical protein
MGVLSRWPHCSAAMFGVLMLVAAGCAQKPTPEEFGRWVEEFNASTPAAATSHYKCDPGDRGWDYVCVVSWEAKSSARLSVRPQRIGFKIRFYRDGRPVWSEFPLPDDGPVLSEAEATAWFKKRQADAAASGHR